MVELFAWINVILAAKDVIVGVCQFVESRIIVGADKRSLHSFPKVLVVSSRSSIQQLTAGNIAKSGKVICKGI